MSMFAQTMTSRVSKHAERRVAPHPRVPERPHNPFELVIEILVEAHAMMRQADRRVLSGCE